MQVESIWRPRCMRVTGLLLTRMRPRSGRRGTLCHDTGDDAQHAPRTQHVPHDNIQRPMENQFSAAHRSSNSKDRRISQYSVTIMRKYYDLTKIDSLLWKFFTKTAPTFEVVCAQTPSPTHADILAVKARPLALSCPRASWRHLAGHSCGPFARIPSISVGLLICKARVHSILLYWLD